MASQSYEEASILVPIFQVRKLRHTEASSRLVSHRTRAPVGHSRDCSATPAELLMKKQAFQSSLSFFSFCNGAQTLAHRKVGDTG